MKNALCEITSVGIGVEPFAEPQSHIDNSTAALAWFAKSLKDIFLIAVINPDDLGWPGDIEDDAWIAEVERRAVDNMRLKLGRANSNCSIHFSVIIQKSASRSKTAQLFLEFATKNKIDLLIIHSHTKSNLLASPGSFCNNLVTHSRIPILIMHPTEKVNSSLHTILYPTDFSGLSKQVYESVVSWARPLAAAIKIYHRLATPIGEVLQIALHPIRSRIVMPSDLVILNEQIIQEKVKSWINFAVSAGGQATFAHDRDGLTLPTAIIAAAEMYEVDLIAIPTHTSELNIPSIGSAVCHLLRASSVPVMVVPVRYIPPGEFSNDGK